MAEVAVGRPPAPQEPAVANHYDTSTFSRTRPVRAARGLWQRCSSRTCRDAPLGSMRLVASASARPANLGQSADYHAVAARPQRSVNGGQHDDHRLSSFRGNDEPASLACGTCLESVHAQRNRLNRPTGSYLPEFAVGYASGRATQRWIMPTTIETAGPPRCRCTCIQRHAT